MAAPKKKQSKTRTSRRHSTYVTRRRKLLENRVQRMKQHVASKDGVFRGEQVVAKKTKTGNVTKIEA